MPVTLWITAGMFLLASLPTFLFLRERGPGQKVPAHPDQGTYLQLLDTLATLRGFPDTARFLICIVFYQAGVQAVIIGLLVLARVDVRRGRRRALRKLPGLAVLPD